MELRVLGVYQLEVTPELFAAQLPMYGDEGQCRDHFSSVVLVEAVVDDPDGKFLDSVTQPNAAYPGGRSQVPWDEGLLSADGETLITREIGCVKGTGPLRFAFNMHYWDSKLPLGWTHGEIVCPAPERMPVRLEMLMPYRPCD